MSAFDELRLALRKQVQREGPYLLASGAESDWYLDCRPITFTFPMLVARAVIEKLSEAQVPDPTPGQPITWAGVVAAGVPIATALACAPGGDYGMGIRPEPKDHGTGGCVMGIPMGSPPKVIVCDDVFTSGSSLLKATRRLQEEWDTTPVLYLTLFNRSADQEATSYNDIPLVSLYGMDDLL